MKSDKIYFKLFVIVSVLYTVLVFHRAVPLLLYPSTTKGVVIDEFVRTYKYRGTYGIRHTMEIATPIILYTVNGRKYRIIGATDSETETDTEVDVIYSRWFPQIAMQEHILGAVNERALTIGFPIWFIISGVLFAMSGKKLFTFSKPLSDASALVYSMLIIVIAFAIHNETSVAMAIMGLIAIVAWYKLSNSNPDEEEDN